MAIQTAEPPAPAESNRIVDVRNGGRINGSRPAKRNPTAPAAKTATSGRPGWMSAALALLAGGLALVGGWMLLQSDSETVEAPPSVVVLYASTDLPAGTTVDAVIDGATSLLEARSVPAEFAVPGSIISIDELESLRGQRLESPIFAGNPVTIARFRPLNDFEGESFIDRLSGIEAPAGHMKVSLRLPPSRALGGSVASGDTVAVLASFKATENINSITTLLLPAVEVIDVKGDRGVAPEGTEDDLDPDAVIDDIAVSEFDITVAVTPQESTRLAYAIENGKILLAVAVDGAAYDDQRVADTLSTLIGRTEVEGFVEQIELEPLPTIDEPVAEDGEGSVDNAETEDGAAGSASTEDGTGASTEDVGASAEEGDGEGALAISLSGGITDQAPGAGE